MAAIKEARENMGDYKLKTAKDYVVPESQRVNAEKKRIQLLNLLDQVNCAFHQYLKCRSRQAGRQLACKVTPSSFFRFP